MQSFRKPNPLSAITNLAIMLLLLIFYLAIAQLTRTAVHSQNTNNNNTKTVSRIVYTNGQLRQIGRSTLCSKSAHCLRYLSVCAKSTDDSLSQETQTHTTKKARRKRRGGKRKQKKTQTITNCKSENLKCQRSRHLRCSLFNAQAATSKTVLMNDLITDLDTDLMVITESWLKPVGDEAKIEEITPPGFTPASLPRLTGTGGGVLVVHKTSISCKPTPLNYKSFEGHELRLQHSSGITSTKLIAIYRPPPSRKNKLTKPMFIEEFEDLLDRYAAETGQIILLGDINFHYDSITDCYTNKLKTMLHNRNLRQIVEVPTHIKKHTLDWIIIRDDDSCISNLEVLDKALSDHCVISFDIFTEKPEHQKRSIKTRNLKNLDQTDWSNHFKSLSAQRLTSNNPDCLAISYNKSLETLLDKHAPLTTRTVTDRPSAPWLNSEVKEQRRVRRQAERAWRKEKTTVKRQIYQHQHLVVKNTINKAKKDFYRSKIMECSTSKALFRVTNELSGKPKQTPLPDNVPKDTLPDYFCNYFNDKIAKLRNELDEKDGDPSYESFSGDKWEDFQLVDSKVVKDIIVSSAPKTCVLDPIPSYLVQEHIDDLVNIIASIINSSLRDGVVPSVFKTAAITPLLKKAGLDQNILKNFRPVSNLPFVSKVLEKVVLTQLNNHLKKNGLIEPFQSAYKAGHCTETALLRISSDLLNAADEGLVTMLSLIDLSAAFDTIDHGILLKRLSVTFGISGNTLKWFTSYLSDRRFFVLVEGIKSSPKPLKYGVPQGSVLGPILYSIYTFPLGNLIRKYNIPFHMYADDTQLYKSSRPSDIHNLISSVKSCIEGVREWMAPNKLKMNEEKTEIIPISTSQKLNSVNVGTIIIGNDLVPFSKKAKNLGVLLDNDMSMESYVNHICKVAYLELRRIGHIRQYLDVKETATLVSSFILSRLDYCNSLLAGVNNEKINKLQRIQNSAAKLVLKKRKHDHVTPLLKELHWLPVKARITYKLALTAFKCKHTDYPSYLSELLVPYTPMRQLRSSTTNKLSLPRVNLKNYGERAFTFTGPLAWNSLPESVRNTTSLDQFKVLLKTHLFIEYFH